MTPTVLIAGSGYTGDIIADRLRADHAVWTLSRQPKPTQHLLVDLDQPAGLAEALSSAAIGTHPFDLVYLVPPNCHQGIDIRLDALRQALPTKPRRIVLASTTGVYGDHQGGLVTEATPVAPQTARAEGRVCMEKTAERWVSSDPGALCILRIAGIYGPGRLPVASIKRKNPVLSPEEANPGNRIHVSDLADAFILALSAVLPPSIINVADGDHTNGSEFTMLVADELGLARPPIVSRAQARDTFSPMRLSFLNESRQISNHTLTQLLGLSLRYPKAIDGIRAAIKAESASS